MTTKTRKLFIAGLILLFLGIIVMIITSMFIPFSDPTFIMPVGILLIIAGVVFFALAVVQIIKERRQPDMGRKPITAAMVMQAQEEYNKMLAAYSKDGASADELTQAKLFAQAVIPFTLISPSAAVFSDLDAAFEENNGTYTVTGWVDVQNIFGAMMREPFSIIVFKKDGVWQAGPYWNLTRPL